MFGPKLKNFSACWIKGHSNVSKAFSKSMKSNIPGSLFDSVNSIRSFRSFLKPVDMQKQLMRYIVLLQHIVTMFLKSKQQIIREQLQLKTQKSSQSLRQSLPKSTKNTATRKTRTEGGENAAKAQNATPGIVTELRKNAEIPEKVEQFLASLKEGDASSPLHFLTGKGLVRILKSLDLPCFSGKGKAKQIDTLKKFFSSVEVVNIKYPEKYVPFSLYHNILHS